MIRTVISLLAIVIFSSFGYCLDFNFSYPSEVDLNDSFIVGIEADSSQEMDVKIFAIEEKEIISEIYQDGWKNPFFYLKEAFPSSKEFKIKILKEGEYELCVRLRISGKTAFDEKSDMINVEQQDSETEEEEEEINETETNLIENEREEKIDFLEDNEKVEVENVSLEAIRLNKIDKTEEKTYKSNKNNFFVYSFR